MLIKPFRLLNFAIILVFLLSASDLTAASGSQQAQPAAKQSTADTSIPIVFLPGLMGSSLTNTPIASPGCQARPVGEIWVNLLGLLNPFAYNENMISLWLKEDDQAPDNDCDVIAASAIIDTISLGIPGADIDVYGNLLLDLENNGFQVHRFPYDWRLDLESNAQKLDAFLSSTFGGVKVVLLGHSMGGLLARQYTLSPGRAARVDKVISMGTPYWGAPLIARHARAGTTPLPMDFLLYDPYVWQLSRNSPGSMQVLPGEGYFQQAGSYYINQSADLATHQETTDFFTAKGQNKALLDKGKSYHQASDDFRLNLHVPYYVLAANHLPSATRVREYPCWFGLGTCWQEIAYQPGDGTVPWVSARLYGLAGDWSGDAEVCTFPPGHVTLEHGQIMSDPFIITDIHNLLLGQPPVHCQPTGPGSASSPILAEPYLQISVWGALRASVRDQDDNFTGLTQEGYQVNQIPSATHRLAENGVTFVLPTTSTYTLTIHPELPLPLQVQVTEFRAGAGQEQFHPHKKAVFIDIPGSPGGSARLPVDPGAGYATLLVEVDLDGDGVPDQFLPPTSVLDQAGSQDYTPPTTRITVQGFQNGMGFYTGPVLVTLNATDAGVGVYKTEYSLDGGLTWLEYVLPLAFPAELAPVFSARSVDLAGNQEMPWAMVRLQAYKVNLPLVRR